MRMSSSNGCLIAALAYRLGIPLYTFNVRHLGTVSGIDVRQPYVRR